MNVNEQGGLTLLELLVGILVLSILLSAGVPGFQSTVNNNRLAAQTNALVTALNLARSEAVKRSEPVSVCASADQATCSGAWTEGWIAFTDASGTAGTVDASGDTVLQVWPALSGPNTLTSGVAYVQYQPSGRSAARASFELKKPGCSGENARKIAVTVTGRVNSKKDTC